MINKTFQILEENTFFIVINKPEGLSAHNGTPSVVEQLTAKKKPTHLVNRLDQETSGLMIIAKDPEHHVELADSMEAGSKIYKAVLRSPWKKSDKQTNWSWSISDKAEGYKNPRGKAADRKEAGTEVTILRSNQYFTEIRAELLTGRQHQIRKHAAIAGHPVVGDKRYNEDKYNKNIEKFYGTKRMQLHAEKLVFEFKGKTYEFKTSINFDDFFKDQK